MSIWVLCVTIRACLALQRCCGLPLPYACRHIALAVFDDMFHRLGLPCLTHGWRAVLLWLCTLYLWMLGLAGIYIQWKQDRVPGEVSAHTRARVCVHECVGCGGLLQVQPARSSLAGPLCLLVVDVGGCTRVFSSPTAAGTMPWAPLNVGTCGAGRRGVAQGRVLVLVHFDDDCRVW